MNVGTMMKSTVLAIAVTAIIGCDKADTITVDKSPRPVNVIELGSSDGTYHRYFAGRLESVDQADLSFRVPGTIEAIYVSPGDTVTKGQKVAQLDPHDYQVALLELQARLTEAEASYRLAASELRRVRQAIADNAIAKVNLDRAKSAYDRSKSAIEVVKQNIRKAEDAIRYTTLLAPFDGVVGEQHLEAFEQTLPGVPLINLHKPSVLEAQIDVPDTLIKHFHYGQSAKVFWYGNDNKLAATAKEIGTVPDLIKQTYKVTYDIDDQTVAALPGKAVVVEVNFTNAPGVHCIPYSALKDSDGEHSVFVVEGQKAVQKNVRIDHMLGDEVCVSGNLKQGEKLITSGVSYIQADQEVGKLLTQDKV